MRSRPAQNTAEKTLFLWHLATDYSSTKSHGPRSVRLVYQFRPGVGPGRRRRRTARQKPAHDVPFARIRHDCTQQQKILRRAPQGHVLLLRLAVGERWKCAVHAKHLYMDLRKKINHATRVNWRRLGVPFRRSSGVVASLRNCKRCMVLQRCAVVGWE